MNTQVQTIAVLKAGTKRVMGTDWPIEHVLERRVDCFGKVRWVIQWHLSDGTATGSTRYPTRAAGLEALKERQLAIHDIEDRLVELQVLDQKPGSLRDKLRERYGKGRFRVTRQGEVHLYGTMPNTNQTGWYFAGYAADLAREL